jgi:predicted lactoylglutathione lyase
MDHAPPNLPSRDFEKTAQFYSAIGWAQGFRDDGWMLLSRGDITLEFFQYPHLCPLSP